MVGHHDFDDVLRPALRHVAADATVTSFGSPGGEMLGFLRRMALFALGRMACDGFVPSPRLVRVVTRCTSHLGRLLKTDGLPETVRSPGDLEFVFPNAIRMVEVQDEISQRLGGPVRELAAVKTHHRIRKPPAGRFEVALHTDFELALRALPNRVED